MDATSARAVLLLRLEGTSKLEAAALKNPATRVTVDKRDYGQGA